MNHAHGHTFQSKTQMKYEFLRGISFTRIQPYCSYAQVTKHNSEKNTAVEVSTGRPVALSLLSLWQKNFHSLCFILTYT